MSTILKALRRLEEERTAKAERALRDQVVGKPPPAPRHRRRLVLPVLGVGAGVAILVFALHSWRARPALQAAGVPAPAGWPHPASPQPALPTNPLASAPRPLAGVPAPQGASPPTVIPGGETGVQGAGPAPRPPPAELRAAAAALTPAPDVAVVPRSPPAPNPAVAPSETPAAVATTPTGAVPGDARPSPRMASAPPPPEPSADAEESAPPSVPIRMRDVDPSLHSPYGLREDASRTHAALTKASHPRAAGSSAEVVVTRTVWHPSPERRVALVRGAGDSQEREVHEGESVGSLQVLRIEPSDVVFLREGVEIRQRVGASQ